MDNNIITGLFTLGGVFLTGFFTLSGIALTYLYNYFSEKRTRKDKYYFALITKRFEVYQQASTTANNFLNALHAEDDERTEMIKNATYWYRSNNLYLTPKMRIDFRKALDILYEYSLKKEEYLQKPGEQSRQKLLADFQYILSGFQKSLEKELDSSYYEKMR